MLSEQQFLFIQNRLNESSLHDATLKEELLDHLCCNVETQLTKGIPFHIACQTTFETFQEDEMQDIEQHFFNLNNRKQLIMKRVSVLALGLMFLATAVWALQADPPSRLPLDKEFEISSNYGKRLHPIHKVEKMHNGVDFKAKIGTPIYATSDGKIVKAKEQSVGYGNHVVIQHDSEFSTMYSQMSEIKVAVGQEVKKGDIIGLVGNSGSSTAPHLHYEVRKNGKAIDPSPFLKP